jgi:hypothetical protein
MAAAEPICESPPRKVPVIWQDHTCEGCGKTFRPKRAENNRYCSRDCWYSTAASKAEARAVTCEGAHCPVYCQLCPGCGRAYVSRKPTKCCPSSTCYQRLAIRQSRPDLLTARPCPQCATLFVPHTRGRPLQYCSPSCLKRATKNSFGTRTARAKAAGVICEPVDRTLVFARDGWTCRLCGTGTPRTAMGSMVPNAPELDHVIPLACKGPHTYGNTQCLCRRCNMWKKDRVLGEKDRPHWAL